MPFRCEDGSIFSSITWEDESVVIDVEVNDSTNMHVLKQIPIELTKEWLIVNWARTCSDPHIKKFFKQIVDAETDVVVRYIYRKANESLDVIISSKEVPKILLSQNKMDTALIDIETKISKSFCPEHIDDGFDWIDCRNENNKIIVAYNILDDLLPYIENNKDLLKFVFFQGLWESPNYSRRFVALLVKNNVGIKYEFIGNNSKKKVTLDFQPDELN